ncbi:MAG: hypothetical protein LUG18_03325 [Candidatus Azobacteroides sp.]|nr:hypothetical protein [Candidatus Azobacteroides sp.]
MKKILLLFCLILVGRAADMKGCSWYDPEWDYYNLFMQEIIDDPQYYPFLLTYNAGFYYTNKKPVLKNENIEQWQEYFNISYEDAYYLVFKSSQEDITQLLNGKPVTDPKLNFITPSFVSRYKQAFSYLEYAKMLEPYMMISGTTDSWYYYKNEQTADLLEYEKIVSELKQRWRKSKEKELKLRYGYQLVRFAHYNRNYEEAIIFFREYVASLNYKPAMYYHALSQKAGAERGLGNIDEANYEFLQVFVNSRNLKESAFTSIKLSENTDWDALLERAETEKEINDAYLFLGYQSFTNPINEIEKIIATSPDAIQAKVLMVRAINGIERNVLPDYYRSSSSEREGEDKRYPIINESHQLFFDKILSLINKMTRNPEVKDKNFWYLSGTYLLFLKKDFAMAKSYLAQVEETNQKYISQKKQLRAYLDISEKKRITPELEVEFYEKYGYIFATKDSSYYWDYKTNYEYSTKCFIRDLLANRYFLQGDYAKSFLLNHPLSEIEENADLMLITALENFYLKPDKNIFEQYLVEKSTSGKTNIEGYFGYIRGIVYLAEGDLKNALKAFEKMDPNDRRILISKNVFGVNIAECFECPEEQMMETAYTDDFPFIEDKMTFIELVETLIRLEETGNSKKAIAPEANYLLGNFFYNITRMGYYRHLTRFGSWNYYRSKYDVAEKPDLYDNIYFKYYPSYYPNHPFLSEKYLSKGLLQAKNNELKARIVFALSKWELENYNDEGNIYSPWYISADNILISNRKYFKELLKYKSTEYFRKVESSCKYFTYYTSHMLQ